VVGWLTPDTAFTAANVGKVKVAPVIPAVKKCIEDLKKANPDVHYIIGLSHTGGWLGKSARSGR
jgi:2',3'-cyclic-nucleotide 2'-phosphodiesterase (5'-nucleotidase family)